MVINFFVGTYQRLESIYSWNSAIPEFVCLRKIEIGGFLCHYCEVLLKQQTNIILLFWLPLQVLRKEYSKKASAIGQLATNIKQLQETSFQSHVCPTSSLRGDHWPMLFCM